MIYGGSALHSKALSTTRATWWTHVNIQSGLVLLPCHQLWRRRRGEGQRERSRQIWSRENVSMFGFNYRSVGLRQQTASKGLIVFSLECTVSSKARSNVSIWFFCISFILQLVWLLWTCCYLCSVRRQRSSQQLLTGDWRCWEPCSVTYEYIWYGRSWYHADFKNNNPSNWWEGQTHINTSRCWVQNNINSYLKDLRIRSKTITPYVAVTVAVGD